MKIDEIQGTGGVVRKRMGLYDDESRGTRNAVARNFHSFTWLSQ